MSENYDLVYESRRKCEIYRDTGVSKNTIYIGHILINAKMLALINKFIKFRISEYARKKMVKFS